MNVVTEVGEAMQEIKKDREAFLSGRHKPETEDRLRFFRSQRIKLIQQQLSAAQLAARIYGAKGVPFLLAPSTKRLLGSGGEKTASKKAKKSQPAN